MGSRDRQRADVSETTKPPAPRLEGVALARVKGGWLVVQVSLDADAEGLTLLNPGELAQPYSLAQAMGMVRMLCGRAIQTLLARGAT